MRTFRVETFRRHSETWCIARAREELSPGTYGPFLSLVGSFADLSFGALVQVEGVESRHPKYGTQLKVSALTQVVKTDDLAGVRAYLERLPHVGNARANLLLAKLGSPEAVLAALDSNDLEALRVTGLSEERLQAVLQGHQRQARLRTAVLWLAPFRLSPRVVEEAGDVWGEAVEAVLTADPYEVERLPSGSFQDGETIADALGIPHDALVRRVARACHAVETQVEAGHTWVRKAELGHAFDDEALDAAVRRERLVCEGDYVTLARLARAEATVARELWRRLNDEQVESYEFGDATVQRAWNTGTPHKDQVDALKMAGRERVMCLVGGPGVGKSASTKALVQLLQPVVDDVVVLAPTGKAARRVTELTGLPASTIHRWLVGQRLRKENDDRGPMLSLIIVDEMSMVSVELFANLLDALPERVRLVLVGDPDQLPSIGPGNVLADILESTVVPYVRLTHIFRQASESRIPYFARDVNRRQVPNPLDIAGSDVRFFAAESGEAARDFAVLAATQLIPAQTGVPANAVRILTAMRSRGACSVDAVNEVMQRTCAVTTGPAVALGPKRFVYLGEPVMHTKNNYQLEVMNGETGFVVELDMAASTLTVDYGDRTVRYQKNDLAQLTLAYALTIHKSQGSSMPVVLILCDDSQSFMLTRALLYTAVTRAEKLAVFVGQPTAFVRGLQNNRDNIRLTRLREKLTLQKP